MFGIPRRCVPDVHFNMIRVLYLISHERPLSGVILSQVAAMVRHMNSVFSKSISIKIAYQIPLVDLRKRGIVSTAQELRSFKQEAGLSEQMIFILPSMIPTSLFYMPSALVHCLIPGIKKLKRILEAENFDLIHARGYPAVLVAMKAIKDMIHHPKLVFDMRGLYPFEGVVLNKFAHDGVSFNFWKQVEIASFHRADAILTLSSEMSKYVRSYGGNPFEIAPCVITEQLPSVKSVRDLRHDLGIDQDALVFAFSGTLGTWHSIDNLLRMYRSLKEGLCEWLPTRTFSLIIISPSFIPKRLLSDDILKVNASPKEVIKILKCADIGLVPLRDDARFQDLLDKIAETMGPAKVAEYLAAGLAIVSDRRAKALVDFIEHNKIGLSFDVGREVEAIKRLINIFNDCDIKMRARKSGELKFGLNNVANQIAFFYNKVQNDG